MTARNYRIARLSCAAPCCAFVLSLVAPPDAHAADWPMWRYNAARGAATPDALPERLEHAWTIELPLPRPAWPATQGKLQFDAFYEPVVAGKRLFVPSMVSDSVTAFDESVRDVRADETGSTGQQDVHWHASMGV